MRRAATLLAGAELHEPLLLAFELTNVAWTKARANRAHLAEIGANLEDVLSLELTWEAVDHQAVLHLAVDTGLSSYDATYLWVARRLGVPLVTFDRHLGKVATRFGLS